MASRPPSRLRTAGLVGVVMSAGWAAMALGLPSPSAILAVSGIGSTIVVREMAARRVAGAESRMGDTAAWPLRMPAERYAVGRLLQLRLLGPSRDVWSPGLLCVASGEGAVRPLRNQVRDRAWEGPVTRAEVHRFPPRACVVRLHGDAGSAQFAVQYAAHEVRPVLARFVDVDA